MSESVILPTLSALKDQAKRLRTKLELSGTPIAHSQSLELMAYQHGYRDWNTLHASVGNRSRETPVWIGQRVRGTYLGQSFEGEIIGVERLLHSERYRVTLVFDEPVDVITFEGMSNYRKRVSCTIGSDGRTFEKTSNGLPHLVLQI